MNVFQLKFRFLVVVLLSTNTAFSVKYYISPTGSDTNNGSQESPFKTISKGASVALAGDTVFVLEGVYRERVSPPRGGSAGKPIVYLAEPDKNVFIKGSDIWKPGWKKNAPNVYYAIPEDSLFNDDCYVDNKNPFKVASSSTPYGREGRAEVVNFGYSGDINMVYTIGQVFVDGEMYIQKPYLSEMKASARTWFYDRNTDNLYIHFPEDNPNKYTVEISTRRRIFAPHKRRLGYINVEGFIMEHCGNQYPANFWEATRPEWQQAGALGTRSGNRWVIKNNVIRFANGVGIDFGNEGNSAVDLETGSNGLATGSSYHIIDSNYISDNGAAGTAAYFPSNVTFTNNVLERNVNLMFVGNKRWESAGVKMHGPRNTLVANNLFRDNYGKWTLWFDGGAGPGTRVHRNLIIGGEKGFDLEIGTAAENKLILDNNIIVNQDWGISIRNAGGITALHNLILGSTKVAIYDFIDKNRTGSTGDHQFYFNNVVLNSTSMVSTYPPDYYFSSNRKFDYNIYHATPTQTKFNITTVGAQNFASWQNRWKTYNSSANYDFNSKLTTGISYSIDIEKLTLQLTVDDVFMNAGTLAFPTFLDQDYKGNSIKSDGTASPGPFQNLTKGANIIHLWNGLTPLKVYENPTRTSTSVDRTFWDAEARIDVKMDTGSKMLHFQFTSKNTPNKIQVSLYALNGQKLHSEVYTGNGQQSVSGIFTYANFSPGVYLMHFSSGDSVVSKKIIL